MEQQLLKQKEEITRLKKELEEFAYIASHDLQEPLRKIASFGERLGRDTENFTESQKLYLDRMLHATERMQHMLHGLLAYSRAARQQPAYEKTDLNVIITKVIQEMDKEIKEKGAHIKISTLPVIDVIPDQITAVFQHILSNSLKFIQQETHPDIEISAQSVERDRVESEELDTEKEYTIIRIKDNGIGFDNDNAKRIFQPFQRLRGRSEYEGSGMGLAICQMIAINHAGKIQAHSQTAVGTTIEMLLPVQQEYSSLNS